MVPVKLLVLGAQNTGKTALCVRFMTKRFIGEYDHKKEVTYRCSRMVDQETVDLEILDLPWKSSAASTESSIRWADGFLLLYSITQRSSFQEIPRLKTLIDKTKQSIVVPTVLVANKADLEIGRKVTNEEGQRLAKDLGFHAVSENCLWLKRLYQWKQQFSRSSGLYWISSAPAGQALLHAHSPSCSDQEVDAFKDHAVVTAASNFI